MADEQVTTSKTKITRRQYSAARLAVMRAAYENREKLSVVASLGETTVPAVAKLARRRNWRRSPARYGKLFPGEDWVPEDIGLLRGRWALRMPGMKEAIRRAAELP